MSPSGGSICKACADGLSHFYTSGSEGKTYQHLTLEGIRQAASQGCKLCAYIKLWVEIEGCCKISPATFDFYISHSKEFLLISHRGIPTLAHEDILLERVDENTYETPPMPEASRLGQTTQSAHSQALARRWMHSCAASHDRCAYRLRTLSNLGSSQLPARLLDLRGAHSNRCIRVVHTETETIEGPYATLSHCWGKNPLIKLRKANLEQFSRRIEIKKLPKTFRDAIEVCGWYNFRYLWVDSLCIVQDSKADWDAESAAMKRIHSNGILNIAASSAVDSSGGLFQRRSPLLQIPLTLDIPKHGTCVLRRPIYAFSKSIKQGPLASRGWVLQEWLLAPRVLHFGEQLFWECPETLSCEAFPLGKADRSEMIGLYQFYPKSFISSLIPDSQLDPPTNKAEIYKAWRGVCREYSKRNLTVNSDRIVALAGIVDLFQSVLADTFITGHWKSTIIPDLCWVCEDERYTSDPRKFGKPNLSKKSVRPPEYGAPSWSWMSVNNEIHWQNGNSSQELAALCGPNRNRSHEELRSGGEGFDHGPWSASTREMETL
ncbi:HET-domain-containing protein [Karstenula rhodostoma CBS 690.94]|uniref:HET-domain-containing protein n=1 Tax=Karstenula rhodostoma CBS 690.94 TaxID=1392251 RepID=A0A9P4PXU5_9PLEO|nr:HET-domain-containing protein [Karstenula rhodostoma CBS 690.94]